MRKEASWQSWRDHDIEPEEYDNDPTEGFALNKKVGGYAGDWGDFRQTYVRVYDPRGFEFEITVPNLLYILENTSSIKGKGLEGAFIYGWDGTDLVLIPTCSPDCDELSKLNAKRFKNETIKAKDLKIGATYLSNSNDKLVYMGRFDYYTSGYLCGGKWFKRYKKMCEYAKANNLYRFQRNWLGTMPVIDYSYSNGNAGKIHWFYSRNSKQFIRHKSLSGMLIDVVSAEPATDYADLFNAMESVTDYSPIDDSKDKYIGYTLPEFEKLLNKISDWRWDSRSVFAQFDDGSYMSISIVRKEGMFAVKPDDVQHVSEMFETVMEPDMCGGRKHIEMIPASPEELFEKLHPHYLQKYLANGKPNRKVSFYE